MSGRLCLRHRGDARVQSGRRASSIIGGDHLTGRRPARAPPGTPSGSRSAHADVELPDVGLPDVGLPVGLHRHGTILPARNDAWQRRRHALDRSAKGSGGLLLPGAPRTALIAYAATASASLSLALVEWPDDGGTMPSEKSVFTTRVEPVSPPQRPGPGNRPAGWIGGGAGHCPRVHYAYSTNRLSP
jgi:hypothetical protein